jgi:[protein-PII] uridylyltransferase
MANSVQVPRPSELPSLSEGWARLREDSSLRGRDWSKAAGDLTDSWLVQLFDWAVTAGATGAGRGRRDGQRLSLRSRRPSATGENPAQGLALLAVGSLGRGDLAPGSDLDLLLVHDGRPDVVEVADRLWYPIWDDSMPLDHSVRTLSQIGQAAESDLRVAQGLLDARPVAGDAELGTRAVALGRRLWEKRVGQWLPAVIESRAHVQEAHGDVAFMLEPQLQEGRGGLRDLQLLGLMAAVTPVLAAVAADERLASAGDFLHAVRVELQRPSGRRTERLTLEDEDRVAEALGLVGREDVARGVARAGRAVAWLTEDAWRRVQSWLAGPRGRGGSADKVLGPGLVLRDNEVAVPLAVRVGEDPTLALRAASTSAELGLPLSRSTMARLSEEVQPPPSPWTEDITRAFLGLLAVGHASTHAIETLDQLEVWEHYLPEWARVRNMPQFNPYHRWTVDRHLLETVANAAGHQRDVRRPDLLLLGALLHDIGKGTPVDHSQAGEAITAGVGERLGLSTDDRWILQRLVRLHLLLPETATRRDLDDPATVNVVAETVGNETTLELLRGIAVADGEATGPAAWTPWKADLVDQLVERASAVLAGRPVPAGAPFPSEEQRRLMASGGLQILPDQRQLVIVAPDRPGLFSDVTGVLALHGIGVLEARIHSERGHALEVFTLDLPEHADPRWERVVRDIKGALEKRFSVGEALARRPPTRSRRVLALALPSPEVRVIIDNDAATSATVVEVRAPDAVGVLHKVTFAIAAQGLDISSARVTTLANAVVDTFYVRSGGGKLKGHEAGERLRAAIEDALQVTSSEQHPQ